jgi:Tol biopolymer transport system component
MMIAFRSDVSDLVPGDTIDAMDAFVRDMRTGGATRVSVSSAGEQGNRDSWSPFISADGRYVAFSSQASNLVPGDTNGKSDVLVRDMQAGITTRVSVSSTGEQGAGDSYGGCISADGRFVAFVSLAPNLVPEDTNGKWDVFLRDTWNGVTTRVSVSSEGRQADGDSFSYSGASLSADGRYVAFHSDAANLVPDDTNNAKDVFLHDMRTGATTRVSASSRGVQGNAGSENPAISADGRYVAFDSMATNLVCDDTNRRDDVFVRDLWTGATSRVSISSSGIQGNRDSLIPCISADGRYVAYSTFAPNLGEGAPCRTVDLVVRDMQLGLTTSLCGASIMDLRDRMVLNPSLSTDGRYIAFEAHSADPALRLSGGKAEVFVRGPLDTSAPLTVLDVVTALRRIGGLDAAPTRGAGRWNAGPVGASAGALTLADAVRIARTVAGLSIVP